MIRKIYKHDKALTLESGKILPEVEICYHISADEVGDKKVIWICHALTANSDPSEWWNGLVGKGKYFDTDKYFIICANILTSCYGTTGPESVDPETNKPYLLNFPLVSIRDMVNAHEVLRKHLDISQIDLLVGGSSGGFQAVEWSVSNPMLIKNLCLLACNAQVSPWGTAFNESQRMALLADSEFSAQLSPQGGRKGLECARSIAILSYRSYEGFKLTQSEDDKDYFLAEKASGYQRYQGFKLGERFNPYSYYYLTLGLDTHNVGRNRGGMECALRKIEANTLCVGIDSDVLFPLSEISSMTELIPNGKFEKISSSFGHDGFLLENDQIINALNKHITL